MKPDARLDERRIRILKDMFVRTLSGETMEEIAQSHGISRKTLSLWKNSDHGKQLHAHFQKELSVDDIPTFYRVLSEGVAKGEYKKMELFAKIHGMLAPEKQEIVSKVEHHNIVEDGLSKVRIEELSELLDNTPPIKRVK